MSETDFTELDKGEKVDCHIWLYEAEIEILDRLCHQYNTSRSAVLGALLQRNKRAHFTDDEVPLAKSKKPNARSRRTDKRKP